MSLILGKNKDDDLVELSLSSMQKHFACFGASGSGKTVASKIIVEEMVRNEIPVIAFDPQGDIASLAMPEDFDNLKKFNIDRDIYDSFYEKSEVLIWTPASAKGLPLCINPMQFEGIEKLGKNDQIRYFSSTAKNIAALIGYDADSDDGQAVDSILTAIFEHCVDSNIKIEKFQNLISILKDLPDNIVDLVSTVGTRKLMKDLQRKISLLTTGSRRLLFETGTPANIEILLGKNSNSSKTRVSVIYLNTLQTQEEKEFFIASITQLMYQWMLLNPLKNGQDGLQGLYYIDEIAPFIPPVKKPACKESLMLLFKQARKYGIGCLIATQNPGDMDYKALAQFSTTNLGKLTQKQDLKKVQPILEASIMGDSDKAMSKLPGLNAGNFILISPDYDSQLQEINTRRLLTKHDTLSEDKLNNYISTELRQKFDSLYTKTQKQSEDIDDKIVNDLEKKISKDTRTINYEVETESPKVSDRNDKKPKTNKNAIKVVNFDIYEKDLEKVIKPYLEGNIFKSEVFSSSKFQYDPIIMVKLIFFETKGLFKKKKVEIAENLYLHYKTYDLFFVKDKQFQYASVIDMDPHKIEDIDNHCRLDTKDKSEVHFDFRSIGSSKVDHKKIKHLMERKFKVRVMESELILFPTWRCTFTNKKNNNKREIKIDAIFGKPIA
ncbi:MAG: hypothetical protein CMG63_03485 [Candidatus Marinimicrobia bacterium]|nr:hypothetical protein [Candidatus Neomarinimicrobiota bacterium]|tara:strand:+ start:222 stop:2213 length:1992 start_codon:yes stop_codon:yes gene_type:complete